MEEIALPWKNLKFSRAINDNLCGLSAYYRFYICEYWATSPWLSFSSWCKTIEQFTTLKSAEKLVGTSSTSLFNVQLCLQLSFLSTFTIWMGSISVVKFQQCSQILPLNILTFYHLTEDKIAQTNINQNKFLRSVMNTQLTAQPHLLT